MPYGRLFTSKSILSENSKFQIYLAKARFRKLEERSSYGDEIGQRLNDSTYEDSSTVSFQQSTPELKSQKHTIVPPRNHSA